MNTTQSDISNSDYLLDFMNIEFFMKDIKYSLDFFLIPQYMTDKIKTEEIEEISDSELETQEEDFKPKPKRRFMMTCATSKFGERSFEKT